MSISRKELEKIMRKDDKAIIIVPNIKTIFTPTFSAKSENGMESKTSVTI